MPVKQAELLRDELGDRDDLAFEATIYVGEGHGFRDAEIRRDAGGAQSNSAVSLSRFGLG